MAVVSARMRAVTANHPARLHPVCSPEFSAGFIVTIDSEQDIAALKRIGAIVADTLRQMLAAIEPGMTTAELDALGRALLDAAGARSAPQLTYKFPGTTCISINEQVAHGIPGERRILAGDVVNVDVSAELDGYFADTGGTTIVPPTNVRCEQLVAAARATTDDAVKHVRANVAFAEIGRRITDSAKRFGFRIIENLSSHGVGRALHEDPEHILSYADPRDRRRFHVGQVITIEPFLSTRARQVKQASDGWTLFAPIDNRSAQFEHTLIVTGSEPIVVT